MDAEAKSRARSLTVNYKKQREEVDESVIIINDEVAGSFFVKETRKKIQDH